MKNGQQRGRHHRRAQKPTKGVQHVIEFDQVTKTYGKSLTPAVADLTLRVKPGEIVGFLGPNGAGKTTTLKMLVGASRPDTGTVRIHGIDVGLDPITAKQQVGYVPDSPEPYARLTGREYVHFIADIFKVPTDLRSRRLAELLTTFDLTDAVDDRIASYSRGMKQKITVIGALIHEPPVWVLDEPMVGLDPRAARTLKERMRSHCDAGNTVFFSTHVLDVAERLCDRVAIIAHGRLIATGTLEELRERQSQSGGTDATKVNHATLEALFLELTE